VAMLLEIRLSYYKPPPSTFSQVSYEGIMGFCMLFVYPCPESTISKGSRRRLFPKPSRGNVALNVGSKLICCYTGIIRAIPWPSVCPVRVV